MLRSEQRGRGPRNFREGRRREASERATERGKTSKPPATGTTQLCPRAGDGRNVRLTPHAWRQRRGRGWGLDGGSCVFGARADGSVGMMRSGWCQHGLPWHVAGQHDGRAATILYCSSICAWAHCEPLQGLQAEGCDIVISWSRRRRLPLCSRRFLPFTPFPLCAHADSCSEGRTLDGPAAPACHTAAAGG